MSTLSFFVPGIPAPQGSRRYLGVKGGKGITVESSQRVAPWRADIRAAAETAMDSRIPGHVYGDWWDDPIAVTLNFWFPRPKSHYRTGKSSHILRDDAPDAHATKPDLDKLVRAVLDALTGLVWADDSRVAELTATKGYADTPGVHVLVSEAK